MAKIICRENGQILGASIFGARAGELIGEIQLGAYYGIRFYNFYKAIHPYPTYGDVIWQASKKAYVESLKAMKSLRFLKAITNFLQKAKFW